MSTRNNYIDLLKGIAIVGILFYHMNGLVKYGYLGVDVFFVVAGYLTFIGGV